MKVLIIVIFVIIGLGLCALWTWYVWEVSQNTFASNVAQFMSHFEKGKEDRRELEKEEK